MSSVAEAKTMLVRALGGAETPRVAVLVVLSGDGSIGVAFAIGKELREPSTEVLATVLERAAAGVREGKPT